MFARRCDFNGNLLVEVMGQGNRYGVHIGARDEFSIIRAPELGGMFPSEMLSGRRV
jgi:hypothetical protein